ncbi:MAG: hypothetical protein LAO78_10070 [Acidobacteriia bacterium]|nr:hypothetical protein [Terriglobia bacterium]
MKKENGRKRFGPGQVQRSINDVFQALPPLNSEEYLAYIRSAPSASLPPEVLVRAFRQLPPASQASRATLDRLLKRHADGTWDYCGPMVAKARRLSRLPKRDSYEDILQDAFQHMLRVLLTDRGKFAEHSWNAFSCQQLSDAWRERYGRRGERFPPGQPFDVNEEDDDSDPISGISEAPLWHANLTPNQVSLIEAVAQRVLGEIKDKFVRAVASQAWFKNARPNVSGQKADEDSDTPLTTLFVGKSRFQIIRALRQADAQLAAALVSDPDLQLSDDWEASLKKLRPKLGRLQQPAEERK